MGRLRGIASITGAALLLLTGCSTTVAGVPVAPPSAAAKLDTGNYPTKPRIVTAKTDADAWQQEGWRVADAVVNPREIDPEISKTAPGSLPVFDTGYFTTRNGQCIFPTKQLDDLGAKQLQTGYLARATSVDAQKGLTVGLLRFADDAAAQRAVQTLQPVATGSCGSKATRVEVAFAGTGMVAVAAAFTEGTTKPDEATHRRLTSAAIQAQIKNLSVYAPSQVRPGETRPSVDMDIDQLMSRTLKVTGEESNGLSDELGFFGGWMTPHAYELSLGGLGRLPGLQLVGRTSLTTAMRFKDQAAASAARTALITGTPEVVAGVPEENVGCFTMNQTTTCVAMIGSYLTLVIQGSEVQARQAISAAYLILKAVGDK